MANYGWTTGKSGDWNTAADWSLGVAPNEPAAVVNIDAPAPAGSSYIVTIAAGESDVVTQLSVNGNLNLAGSNARPYNAAELEIDGTLTFAAGSAGVLAGSLQTFVFMNNGTIVNPGTVNGFIQAEGNVLFTGTNGFYVTNWLQALGGTVTVDTRSIAELTGNTLFDGIYESQGLGSVTDLGGARQNLIVNIATVEGPPLIPDGWTELLFNGPNAAINEWNGTAYVPVDSTLTTIAGRGTVDVLQGRNYLTFGTLAVNTAGMFNLQAGTVTTAGLDINGGVVQGHATLVGPVVNAGTLRAVGGTLDVTGLLSGTGFDTFDYDQHNGTLAAVGSTLELHGVTSGQTIIMNGYDTLQLDTPATFGGTITARAGDKITLEGITATSAAVANNVLTVSNGAQVVASLAVSGNYAGDRFAVTPAAGGSTISVQAPVAASAPLPVGAAAATPVPPTPVPAIIPAVTYGWTRGVSGDWSTAANWTPAGIPNGAAAGVLIDAVPTVPGVYTVTIARGTADTVAALSLNTNLNYSGTLVNPYKAAQLEIDGTLTFAPGSDGLVAGPLQSSITMNTGTLVNAGTVNAFIQALGIDLITGTNGFYITNWLQSLGTVTVDTRSIAELTGNTLFDGVFEAQGAASFINFGGKLQNLVVNIGTIEGPPLIAGGYTEVIFDAQGSGINEWNGTAYQSIEQTVSLITAGGTLDVALGRNYTTANALTVGSRGLLFLNNGSLTAGGLTVQAGGLLEGAGTVFNPVVNNGGILSSGSDLIMRAAVTGTGQMSFLAPGSYLEVGAVSAGQTVTTAGSDTVVLDQIAAFAGTIAAHVGDVFALRGVTATSAVLTGTSLAISNGTLPVGTLNLAGSYAGDTFALAPVAGGTNITVVGPR